MALVALGAMLPGVAQATDIKYSPSPEAVVPEYMGNDRAETYNVAVRLAEPAMAGMKVTSLSVAFPQGCQPTDVSAWLTNTLSVQIVKGKRQNVPDITSVAATVNDGVLTVNFDDGFVIPQTGLYAGYTFTVADTEGGNATPVAVTAGQQDGAFYLYTSRKYMDWTDRSATLGCVSAMTVSLEGEVDPVSVGVKLPEITRYCYRDNGFNIPVRLTSFGADAIASVEYSYSANGKSGSGVYKLPKTTTIQWGHSLEVSLPISDVLAKGTADLSLKIDKVNSAANPNPANQGTGDILGLYKVPANRPLVEEYTGLSCGYCPRGTAGMEYMNNNYAEEFVGVSIHDGDVMSIFSRSDMPCTTSVYPSAWINRTICTDPYLGDHTGTGLAGPFAFDKVWRKVQEKYTPIDISAKAYWDENNPGQVKVETDVMFVEPVDRGYRIGYYLVEDAMEGANWLQFNYFAGWTDMYGIEEMYRFVYGDTYVTGYYNDVLIMTSDVKGVAGSLPAEIEPEVTYHHTYTFVPSEAQNLNGTKIFQDPDYLKVVAFIVEDRASAEVANSVLAYVDADSAVKGIDADQADVLTTVYYNINGVAVRNPEKGVYIKVQTLSDGTRRSSKVIL